MTILQIFLTNFFAMTGVIVPVLLAGLLVMNYLKKDTSSSRKSKVPI